MMGSSSAAEPAPDCTNLRHKPRTRAEVERILDNKDPSPVSKKPLNILLVAGPNDHGYAAHEYKMWQKTWGEMLSSAPGVTVDTAMNWPSPKQIAAADVIAIYQHGTWNPDRAQAIDAHLAKGGGLVYYHYAVECSPGDPASFAQRIGLAKQTKWRIGQVGISFDQQGDGSGKNHPIGRNFDSLHLNDETYWGLTGDQSKIKIIASEGANPQVWTYEPVVANAKEQGRVFVTVLGHNWASFNDPLFRILLLRGIAWVAKEPVDRFNELATVGLTLLDSETSPVAPRFVQGFHAKDNVRGLRNIINRANVLHDDCLMVGSGWNLISAIRRDSQSRLFSCAEEIQPLAAFQKINPKIKGEWIALHMASGAKNVLYVNGTKGTDNDASPGMAWYRIDPITGKNTLLGTQKCDSGCLVTSANKKGLYLITQNPPAIQVFRIQDDGTPTRVDTIAGKGLGSLGAAKLPSQSGDTPFVFSPDGLFLYNFSDADKSIGWCKVSGDGSLAYVGGCDVEKTLRLSDVKIWNANAPVSMRISPDGKHLYALTTSGGMGLFQRDIATGAITYVPNVIKEVFELFPTDFVFTADGKTAYFIARGIGDKNEQSLWWWSRDPGSGLLTLQGKAALLEGTKPYYLLLDDVLGTLYVIGQDTVRIFSTR